jgi:predicted signal transduction protein with EAL and GGDEF domain
MTKISISEGSFAEPEYGSESEESVEIRAGKSDTAGKAWPKVRSKRITQVLGSGIVLLLSFWAAYIIVSGKKIDTVDVITFELTIVVIICFAIAMHLRRTSVRS